MAHKDVALACQIGGEYSVPMKLEHITLAVLAKVINPGWGTLGPPSATPLQSEDAGVEIKISENRIGQFLEGID